MSTQRSPMELAALHRAYLEATEPLIKNAARILGMPSPQLLMMGGELISNESPFEAEIRRLLVEQCRAVARQLGLEDPA